MGSELYRCETCAKSFETQGKFNRHLKVHSKPHRCKHCERGFALGADLNRHIRARHRLGTDKHACPVISCHFTATRKDNIKQHLKNVHDRRDQSPETVSITQDVVQEQSGKVSSSQHSSPKSLPIPPTLVEGSQNYVGLYEALAVGNISLVQMCLEAGLNVNHGTRDGSTLLHCAARAGQTSMVQFLLEAGASVTVVDANETVRPPVHDAILSGNPETVECLLRAGYDYTNGDGLPKCLARCVSRRILYMCFSHIGGANHPNLNIRILEAAAEGGQVSVVRALLDSHDAFVTRNEIDTSIVSANSEVLPSKLNVPWRPDAIYVGIFTPLHHAAAKGHLEIVQILSKHSLKFYKLGHGSQTPLHVAARRGHANVVKFFIGIDGIDVNPQDVRDRTPLHMATESGMDDVVRALLDHPHVKIDCRDYYGQTPLHYAALHGEWNIADMLLEHGNNNRTSSSIAQVSQIVPYEVMKRLLEHPDFSGEAINVGKDRTRLLEEGLLHLAIRLGDCDLLQLLSHQPDIDINSKEAVYTSPALVLAAELGQIDATRVLLRHKDIDLNSRAWLGDTALEKAKHKGHDSIVDLLVAHDARKHGASKYLQGS